MVWRSVRAGGDTKTRKSRRTLALPARCVDALRISEPGKLTARRLAGPRWQDDDLVFASEAGTPLDAANVTARIPPDRQHGRALRSATGHHASCGTASCRCCPTAASPSSTSPAWSGTAARR